MKKPICMALAALLALGVTACSSDSGELVSKTAFPEFSELDTQGNTVTSDIFSDYDATVVNFWSNGCGTCIEEMPELEALYHELQERNINLIGVASDSGESDEQLQTTQEILEKKGVTYVNLSPDPDQSFYQDFLPQVAGYCMLSKNCSHRASISSSRLKTAIQSLGMALKP